MKLFNRFNRRTPRFRVLLLALLPVMTVVLAGGTAAGDDPARDLVAQSVDALGGLDKVVGWETRIDKGLVTSIWPGWGTLNADCVQMIKKPGKMKLDQDYSAYDHPFFFIYYCNDGDVWVNVNLGIRQHPRYTEQITTTMKRIDGMAYFLTHCDTFYLVPEIPDDSLFAGNSLKRVGIVDDGDTLLFDLDAATYLPVRRIEDGGSTHVILEDYRDVGGIKMPFHVTGYHDGVKATEYQWEEITFNQPIDDAVFEEDRPKQQESQ